MRIGTHAGKFHTDEVFAIALLLLLYPDANVIRTRDYTVLRTCDMRVDVGYRYNFETGDFDHHQKEFEEIRPNGIKYASFGLIWKHFGLEICNNEIELHQLMDERLVQPIDAADSGQSLYSGGSPEFFASSGEGIHSVGISRAISTLNSMPREESGDFTAFDIAVRFAKTVISSMINEIRNIIESRDIILDLLNNRSGQTNQRVFIVSSGIPWIETLFEYEKTNGRTSILIAIIPNDDQFLIQCVPESHPHDRQRRRLLPEQWLTDSQFQNTHGITFCHRDRYLAKCRDLESTLRLAELATAS
jgi:uncharacterized UPF0160 family protein